MNKKTMQENRAAIKARWAAKVMGDKLARTASTSWWIGLDRAEFYAAARREAERLMRASTWDARQTGRTHDDA